MESSLTGYHHKQNRLVEKKSFIVSFINNQLTINLESDNEKWKKT